MNLNTLFENREPYQQAIDKLEARRIEDLEAKMDDFAQRARESKDPKVIAALRHEFAKAKAERDSYYGVKSAAVEEGWSDKYVAQQTGRPRTPYSVYIGGKKWKDFENDDHARAVMDKLKAKFKADGRDAETVTIAPTEIPEGTMTSAEKHSQGPKFTGYWKGTDSATPGNKMVGSMEEGAKVDRMVKHIEKSEREAGKSKKDAESIAWATANKRGYLDNANKKDDVEEGIGGNMQVRSTPLNLRTPKVPQISKAGQGPHNNALKKAQAKRMTENFIQWAVNEGYTNFTKDPAVYEQARQAYEKIVAEEKQKGVDGKACWKGYKRMGTKQKGGKTVDNCVKMEEDWQKANKKDKTDGMSQKAVNAYKRENPGSKLKTAVTTKPSKLKKGSKASKRRSSYCSRSKGQQKMHNISCSKTPDKAICKARRRWNCESQEQFDAALFETMEQNKVLAPGEYFVWTVYFDDGTEKQIKVTKDTFDPKAYYAKKNQNVIKVDYSWDVQGG